MKRFEKNRERKYMLLDTLVWYYDKYKIEMKLKTERECKKNTEKVCMWEKQRRNESMGICKKKKRKRE